MPAQTHAGDSPRILLLDIETWPNLAYVWGAYEQNVLSIKQHSIICSFSAKWLNGEQTTRILPDYRGYRVGRADDKRLVADIWKLLDEADIAIAQNGDKFDFRKINNRFARHGLPPPRPYQTVDTLKVARRVFGFDSNKLDDLCAYLGIGRKMSTGGFELWLGCIAGDDKAWERMRRYNAHDVRLLEELYLRFLPWISNHPNRGAFTDGIVCPKCGSGNLQARGSARTTTATYHRYQCRSCGGWSKSRNATGNAKMRNIS